MLESFYKFKTKKEQENLVKVILCGSILLKKLFCNDGKKLGIKRNKRYKPKRFIESKEGERMKPYHAKAYPKVNITLKVNKLDSTQNALHTIK